MDLYCLSAHDPHPILLSSIENHMASLRRSAEAYSNSVLHLESRARDHFEVAAADLNALGIRAVLIEHVGVTTPYAIGGIGAVLLGCAVPWILPAPVGVPETLSGRWEDGVSG